MRKESIHNIYTTDLENCLSDPGNNQEHNKLMELVNVLASKDFSQSSNKTDVFNRIQSTIKGKKGGSIMKRKVRTKRIAIIAASLAVIFILGIQTSFAQEFLSRITKSIFVGHSIVHQIKNPMADSKSIPEGVIIERENDNQKVDMLEVKNLEKLNMYTCFKVILPGYLPTGFLFDKAELYKDDKGDINKKYVNLYFVNKKTGSSVYIQQRFVDKETGVEMGTDDPVEEVKINGVNATIINDKSINWEYNNVFYMLFLNEKCITDKSELIKIAESIK